jgi:hypothetical protein
MVMANIKLVDRSITQRRLESREHITWIGIVENHVPSLFNHEMTHARKIVI